jgi:hypothetical protein
LQPFAKWTSPRGTDTFWLDINLKEGQYAWDKALAKTMEHHTWRDTLNEYEENVIFLLFTNSWPDGMAENPDIWIQANFHLRWLWAPCFLYMLIYSLTTPLPQGKAWIVFIAFAMTWAFLLQDVGIVEGRYRKVIEPFLIVSIFFLFESRLSSRTGREGVISFAKEIYIYPALRLLVEPIFIRDTAPPSELLKNATDVAATAG